MSLGLVEPGFVPDPSRAGVPSRPTCLIVEDQVLVAMSLEAACPELRRVSWLCKPCDREALLAALMRAALVLSTMSTRAAA